MKVNTFQQSNPVEYVQNERKGQRDILAIDIRTHNIGEGAVIAENISELSAVSTNTADTIVKRDSSGNFAANTITASLVGTASGNESPLTFSAPLSRSVNTVSFNYTLTQTLTTAGIKLAVRAISTNDNILTTDTFIAATGGAGGITLTLPAASTTGLIVIVEKIDAGAGAVVVQRAGSDTIEGANSFSLAAQYNGKIIVAGGGTVWYILAST